MGEARSTSPPHSNESREGPPDARHAVAHRATNRIMRLVQQVDAGAKVTSVLQSRSCSGSDDGVIVKMRPSVSGDLAARILVRLRTTWPLLDVALRENHLDAVTEVQVHIPTQSDMRRMAYDEAQDCATVRYMSACSKTLFWLSLAVLLYVRFVVSNVTSDEQAI